MKTTGRALLVNQNWVKITNGTICWKRIDSCGLIVPNSLEPSHLDHSTFGHSHSIRVPRFTVPATFHSKIILLRDQKLSDLAKD